MKHSFFARGYRALSIAPMVLAVATFALDADAFKVKTHVASANRVDDEIRIAIANGSPESTLVFEVRNRRLDLRITVKEAYDAILAHPDFFRGGAIGPDGFPDPITGQMLQHPNS